MAGVVYHPLCWMLFPLAAALCLWSPYRRLVPVLEGPAAQDKIKAILWVPIIRLWADVAKMVGYPVGVIWRLPHRRPVGAR
jgi:hypothetical protein